MVIPKLANGKLWTKHYVFSGGFFIIGLSKGRQKESQVPPTFRLGFQLVPIWARERRRSFETKYLGVNEKNQ